MKKQKAAVKVIVSFIPDEIWLWEGAVVEQHKTEERIPGMDSSQSVSPSYMFVSSSASLGRIVSIPPRGDVSGQLWLMCNSLQISSTSSFGFL